MLQGCNIGAVTRTLQGCNIEAVTRMLQGCNIEAKTRIDVTQQCAGKSKSSYNGSSSKIVI